MPANLAPSNLAPPAQLRHCHVCAQPLGPSYWIEDRHRGVHTQCRDWTQVKFIFERQVRALRKRAGEVAVREVLVWLETVRRGWPGNAAAVVDEGLMRLRRVGVW